MESATIPPSPRLDAAAAQLRDSMASIEGRIETGQHATYTRSGALLELAARETAADNILAQRTVSDLTLLDGALARLALALQMSVVDYDTTPSSDDDLRLWRAWAGQLSATFEIADRVWLSLDVALDSSPWKL